MVHIFLCDDEPLFLSHIESALASILQNKHIEYALHSFTNASALFDVLDKQSPDLLLLDLMLGEDDGFAIAETIRQKAIDTEIAFITNYPEKMAQAFPYRPIGFLSKPISIENITPILERFLFFYQQSHTHYTLSTKSLVQHIPIREILYFESVGHQIHLHLTSSPEPIIYPERLDHVEQQLSAQDFVRCHKSFLVNIHAISSIDRSSMQLTLSGGQMLPISRRYCSNLIEQFTQDKLR